MKWDKEANLMSFFVGLIVTVLLVAVSVVALEFLFFLIELAVGDEQ